MAKTSMEIVMSEELKERRPLPWTIQYTKQLSKLPLTNI